jgi:predicted ATP-dependent serine protease
MGIMEQRAAHRIETRKDRLRYITIDYDTPWTTVAKQIDYTRASTNIDVLVVDYLDCIGRISSNDGRPDLDLKDLFQAMVNYAKHNNLLLITAQQLKSEKVREIHKQVRAGKDIHASTGDVAGSKGVGAIADYMLLLMIDREKKRIQLRTMKARMAPSGDPFVLEYIPEKMLMTDPSGQRVYEPAERLVQENTIQQEEKEVYKEEGITPPEGHGSEVLAPEEERPWVE